MYGSSARFGGSHKLLPDQRCKGFLKRERSIRARDGDLLMQVLQRILADMLPRAIADHEELGGRNSATADPWQEILCHNRCERDGEFLPDGSLTFRWEGIGHAGNS